MTIDPKETIAGCSMLRIRDFIRSYSIREFDLITAAKALDVEGPRAAPILEWLEAKGYIEPVQSGNKRCWTGTDRAGALANASAGKKISRTTADRLLREILERAAQVNKRREFAYYVRRIVVWGSYLGTEAAIGDLDIAVELRPLAPDISSQRKLEEKRIRAAYASGRRMRNMVQELYWPQEEVLRFLKGRSRSCHFTSPDDRIFLQAPQRVVFEAAKSS